MCSGSPPGWGKSRVVPAGAAGPGGVAPGSSPSPRPRCRERRPRASGSRVSPVRCRRASRREKAVSRGEGVRWLRLERNTKLLGSEKRHSFAFRSAGAGSPHLPPPPSSRPESQGNRKRIRVSSRWHLFLVFTEV